MEKARRGAARGWGGWVLPEILVSLVLVLFFTAALVQAVTSMHRCLLAWDRGVRMRQVLAGGLFCMTRDLRMSGCNPRGAALPRVFDLEGAGGEGNRLTIRMDRRGREPGTWPDGDMEDADEEITYHCDFEKGVLRRNGQPMALGLRRNPDGRPLFRVRESGRFRLLETAITLAEAGESVCLSAQVQIRNPF